MIKTLLIKALFVIKTITSRRSLIDVVHHIVLILKELSTSEEVFADCPNL